MRPAIMSVSTERPNTVLGFVAVFTLETICCVADGVPVMALATALLAAKVPAWVAVAAVVAKRVEKALPMVEKKLPEVSAEGAAGP